MLNHVIIYPLPCMRIGSEKWRGVSVFSGDVNRGLGSRWLELACLVGGLLDLWPPHGSALIQSLVCCHFNQTISPSKLTHTSFLWIVDTLGHSVFDNWYFPCKSRGHLAKVEATSPLTPTSNWSYMVCYGSKPSSDWIMIGIEIFVKCFWLP